MILANASTLIRRALRGLYFLASRLASDRGGNVVMIFALVMPALLMITLGGIDLNRITTVKARVQDALDAATLAAARSSYTDSENLQKVALVALRANLRGSSVEPFADSDIKIVLTENQVVVADMRVQVKTLVANIVLPPYGKLMDDTLPVSVHSEVNRSSKDIEVSLVLDITGSMGGSRIRDLKNAANQLIKLVVQPAEKQTPYYSRMAIVPYSIGVNLGSWADGARGAEISDTAITGAAWAAAPSQSISNITRASPGVVTANGHNLASNDYVWISGVNGMTQINDRIYRVVRVDANRVSLQYQSNGAWYTLNTTSGNGFSSYSYGGQIRKCTRSDCFVTVTSRNHGLSEGEGVAISDVRGMTALNTTNGGLYEVCERPTNDTFVLPVGGAAYADYASDGAVQCGRDGCASRVFRDAQYNRLTRFDNTACVSERTGSAAYSDAAPGAGTYVGRNYPAMKRSSPQSQGNPCPTATIQPLTSNINTLTNLVNGLSVTGSTAGQIGLAWGWYAVSDQFNRLWPSNTAAAYAPTKVLKAVILMTDGEFNTPYCGGVVARDAGSGSGNYYDKIACDATNGDPFDQAARLCDSIKAKGVIVYTVGFSITQGSDAARILSTCATDKDKAFLPQSGADLSSNFQAIGRDITRLRISR